MKSAYSKDSNKMFKNNLGRFISIVLIIMLGTAFFIGMNSVSPAMEQTAEKYMKDKHIYDFSLVSNMGYKQEDVEKLQQNSNIIEAQGIYSYDALASFNDKDIVVRLASMNDDSKMNESCIIEGRNIENDHECFISSRLKDMYEYDVGQTIKVYRKDDTNIEDSLNCTEFEIVGVVKNPMYLSKFYGNTTLSTGELHSYMFVKEEAFKLQDYTTVYLKANIDENILKFSKEYQEKNDDIFEEINKTNQEIAKEKYDKIYNENVEVIQTAEEQIQNAEEYVKNKYAEIQSAQLQINQSMSNVTYYIAQYYQSDNLYDRFYEKAQNIANAYTNLNELEEQKTSLENKCDELRPKTIQLKNELESIENNIEKNLYEIYSLDDEAVKFVNLSQENYKLYYEYNQKNREYQTLNEEYESQKQQLETTQKSIQEKNEQINTLQVEIYSSFQAMQDLMENITNEELVSQSNKIAQAKKTVETALQDLTSQNLEEKIKNAKENLNREKNELNQFKLMAETTPLYKNSGFKALEFDLEKITIMGKIFPVMFFVIATLVTITTITRMIEEDRKNIGTLKALGYHQNTIIGRYIRYALWAGILGTILGTLVGSLMIVEVLFVSYSSLYDLPELETKFNLLYILISLGISLLSTVLFAWIVTRKALKENTAELMRPKMGTTGKNILLEKVPFFWNRLDFLFKICFRNIFRYKKRLLMTLIGIAGCTALIYAGLGLQSAVNSIGDKQFQDIRIVSMEVYLKEELNQSEIEAVEKDVKQQKYVQETAPVKQQSLTVEAKDHTKDVFYIAISESQVDNYIKLKNRKTQEKIELNDEGVVLTEKLANILDVTVGEKIDVIDEDTNATVKVIGITENYLYNYLYFTPKVYERIYGTEMKYNEIFVNTAEIPSEKEETELSEDLKENDKIASTVWNKNIEKEFKTSLASLMIIVILFLGCASLLSFTVLINLNNINIEERKRELSTIKLLGFYEKELESYVFRENIILTILGTLLGLVLGMGILGVVIQAAEVETIFLVKDINYINLGLSVIITICFTLITNWMMKKKIKNIDMIDSLKSIE